MADVATPERTLPHNLEAEKSVLGAILVHNDAFNAAAEVIDARDFFRDAHRRIFDRMVAMNERGSAIDLVTLKEELSRVGELEEVGGPAYVASLSDGVPRSANVEYYAKIVKEKSTLRSLIHSANKILVEAYEAEEEPDLLLDEAERAIFAIAEDRIRAGFVPLRDLVQSSFTTIEKLQQHKGLVTGVPTGFIDLDEMTSGLQPSDLILVAARPSMGKTSFVLNIAQHVGTSTDMTVGFFSLEMSKEQLFMRLLTSEGLRAAVARARHARRGARVHRRHGVDRRARDAREGAPPQGRAWPAPPHHRLHPVDAGTRPVREPSGGARLHFPFAEGAREGVARAHRGALAAVARP
jgi:replicative DNA helicase